MYNVSSKQAEEFIDHQEILNTLDYARTNKNNRALIESLLEKAASCKGLSHREAALLLECDQPDLTERIFHLAREIKQKLYGNRIVMFAPLYLSNYCVNGCVYCPYHAKNRTIARKKLSQEEIRREVIALQDMGHKRLALEAGEDPLRNPIDYILESIQTIYGIHHKNGAIRRVNVNIAATTVENYRRLRDAGIGTYILFQETYHKGNYEVLHPTGPKSKYSYHTEAMDRAMEGGIDDVGIGVLFGLNTYRYDFVGLLMHAEHLEAAFGVGPHTISVPRICPADDIETKDFPNAISDEMFCRISLNHFKGHETAGFGGAIKNIGMGCGSRAGKMEQHAQGKPEINESLCRGCKRCMKECANDGLVYDETTHKMHIDHEKCLGCGRCIGACNFDAIHSGYDAATKDFNCRMAEYAKAVVDGRPNFHISLVVDVSPNCDCHCENDAPILPNIGMFASFDPLALDQACVDVCLKQTPLPNSQLADAMAKEGFCDHHDHFENTTPNAEYKTCLEHAEKIGIGSRDYELITIS